MIVRAPFGKAGKAGKEQRPEVVPRGSGPMTGGNIIPSPPVTFGRQPIPFSYSGRLHLATSLVSPMVAGRFRPQDKGAPQNRDDWDPGALQAFRGLYGRGTDARLGAQSGPSSQPAFPATNNTVLQGLAAMGMPDVIPIGGLR